MRYFDAAQETTQRNKEARRKFTRSKGSQDLLELYRISRTEFKVAIRNSKRRCWTSLIEEVDKDPWGRVYQIVLRKLTTQQPIRGLNNNSWVLEIIKHLFPKVKKSRLTPLPTEETEIFTVEEVRRIGKSLKKKKAPGPGGIPNKVLKITIERYPQLLLKAYNACLKEKFFLPE